MMLQREKKSDASAAAAPKADAAPSKSKKVDAGAGFAAQEAALQCKEEAGEKKAPKARKPRLSWPLKDPSGDMWDVLEKAFPGLSANRTGSADANKFSVRDPASGDIFYVTLEGGGECMGEIAPGTLWVTGDQCYTASAGLVVGDDVVGKVKALRPPAKAKAG